MLFKLINLIKSSWLNDSCINFFNFFVLLIFFVLEKKINRHNLRVVVVVYQSVFHSKNMPIIFFYFLKIIFETSTSKWFENIKNILIKKKLNFFKSAFQTHYQTVFKCGYYAILPNISWLNIINVLSL
jgi:cell division protein YceG involved in septum cleavage